jgi:hypothetical protein
MREGTYEVNDLAEMNFHTALFQVGIPRGVVDKL